MERKLEGVEQLLNLKSIEIGYQEASSSTSTIHTVTFYFNSESEHGYLEDPNLEGYELEVLESKMLDDNIVVLKLRVKR